jgi:sulfoxide reductase heme-binding subunit YedZ
MATDRGLPFVLLLTAASAWALFLSLFVFPSLSADISEHVYWYLGRSAGFVAYWLLFASVALGLAVSSRVFDGVLGRPWVFEVHKFLSMFVLLVTAFHVLIFLPDPWANFTPAELLVPFKSHYRNTAVGLGQLVLYGSLIVSASFYAKGLIGQRGWRLLHYTAFALFLGAMAHGVWAGTDSGKPVVQVSYLASAVAVLFLTLFRILATRAAGGRPRPAQAAG